MPDNIARINGKEAVALAITPAWHGLGTVVDHVMKADEAFKLAQLDWTVEKRQLFAQAAANGAAPAFYAVDAFGIFRTTDSVLLGTCGKMYKPIQNAAGFELIDALLELHEGGAYYETAGALGKGEVVWALARIPQALKVAGDEEHKLHLLFMTRHDGNGSARCKLVDTRVVCQNTLTAALGETGAELRIPHFGNVDEKIAAAKKLMATIGEEAVSLEKKFDFLATRAVTRELFLATMDELYPETEENVKAGVVSKARAEKLANILDLYMANDGNANRAIQGSTLALLNSITNYVDHFAGTDKSRSRSAMFGSGELVKSKAFEVLLAKAEGAPEHKILTARPAATAVADRPEVTGAIADYLSQPLN